MTNEHLALADQIHTLESANTELKRLLLKETNINAVLMSNEPSCKRCAAFESVRQDNAREFQWVEQFQKLSHNMQSQLQEKLTRTEAALVAAKLAQSEEPLSRDAEIVRLREGFAEAKRDWMNANQTALQANKVAEGLASQLGVANDRIRSLEADLLESAGTIKQHEDTIDALRRAPELKDVKAGQCTDLRCRKRDLEMYSSQVEASNQILSLRNETYELRDRIKKCKAEMTTEKPEEVLLPGVYQVIEQATKPVVANLDGFEELKLNLKSFFAISPADDFEIDQTSMYDSFLLDLPPSERDMNIEWMCEACGKTKDHGKQCFGACLLAIGGNSVKRGSKTLWVNVRATREPVFAMVV